MAAYDAQEKDGQHSGQAPASKEAGMPVPAQDVPTDQACPQPSADELCMLALFFDLFQMKLMFQLLAENDIAAEQRGGAAIGYSLFVRPEQSARARELLDTFLADAPAAQEKAQDSVPAVSGKADGQGSEEHLGVDSDAGGFDIDDLDDDDYDDRKKSKKRGRYADDDESSEDDVMAERIIRLAPPITAIACALIVAVSLVYHFILA